MTAKLVDQRWEVNLKRSLGEGGFGQVYRGKDTIASPAVDVAAKRVNLSNEAETKAFLLEISVLRRVSSHPSIITLLGSAQNATHGWMFLEIATGGELFDRLIDSGSLSERAAWPYVKAIAGAIQHCSKHGVIHRDLKLENVRRQPASPPHDLRCLFPVLRSFVPPSPPPPPTTQIPPRLIIQSTRHLPAGMRLQRASLPHPQPPHTRARPQPSPR